MEEGSRFAGAFTRAGLQKSNLRRTPVIDREHAKQAADRGRPKKALRMWTVDEVIGWLRKHVGEEYYLAYGDAFRNHEISGRALCRITDVKLLRLGVTSSPHRQELYAKVQSLVTKSELQSFKDKQKEVRADALRWRLAHAARASAAVSGR